MSEVKIKIKDREMTVQEAREMYEALKELFGEPQPIYYTYPSPQCWNCPYYPKPYYPTWDSGDTSGTFTFSNKDTSNSKMPGGVNNG